MKIPSQIRILGYSWRVVQNKKQGGCFDFKTKIIKVGNFDGEAGEVLLHEILEIILCAKHARFTGIEANMPYEFFFNHTKFCEIVECFYGVLKDNGLRF